MTIGQDEVVSSSGCDGEVIRKDYEQKTISGRFSYESATGRTFQARLRRVFGALVSHTIDGVPASNTQLPRDYALTGVSLAAGKDYRNVAWQAGLSVIAQDDIELAWPFAQLRVGAIESIWGQLTFGSADPLYHARVLGMGMGVQGTHYRAHLGGVLSTMVAEKGNLTKEFAGAELELQLMTSGDTPLSIELGGVLGTQLFGQIGLGLSF